MSSTRPVVIVGTGELAQLAHFYFVHDSQRQVLAFAVDRQYLQGDSAHGLPLVACEDLSLHFSPADCDVFVAIGYSRLNARRAERCAAVRAAGYRLASYVSSRASVWPDLQLGGNCMVMEGNCVQPFVSLGEGVIMFAGSVISHHVQVGDHSFIGSGVVICGGVKVGQRCFIGANATVREHLALGDDCIVGAGSRVFKDAAAGSGYLATPTPDSGIPSSRLQALL